MKDVLEHTLAGEERRAHIQISMLRAHLIEAEAALNDSGALGIGPCQSLMQTAGDLAMTLARVDSLRLVIDRAGKE